MLKGKRARIAENADTSQKTAAEQYDMFSNTPGQTEPSRQKDEKNNLFEWLSINSKQENFILFLLAAGTFLVSFYVVGAILVLISYLSRPIKTEISLLPWEFMFKLYANGSAAIFISTLVLSLVFAYAAVKIYMARIRLRDNDYVVRSKRGTHGNADWMTNRPKELEATLDSTDNMKEPGYIPLGIYKDKVYSIPENPTYDQVKNMNMAIVGASGFGKSYGILGSLIQSRIAYGESFVVTDTKGDLYKTYANVCRDMGFDVQVFDTDDWRCSDSWNCLQDIIDASEEKVYDYVDAFTNSFILNTSHGERQDYWMKNEHDLLRGCMHLVCRDRSFEGRRTFKMIIDLINGPLAELDALFETAEEKVKNAAANFINTTDPKLRDNYRSGLANRLQIFRSLIVKECLSYPGIDFEKAVHHKTAIFLITRDDNSVYDSVTSLFIGCLYSKLVEISKSENYGNKLKIPFWIITDELCNMAAINDFSKKISTNRSRNIRLCFAIQSMSQLDGTYVGLADNIIDNCGIVAFFGSSDEKTVKYITRRCGTYTQVVKGRRHHKNKIFRRIPLEYDETVQEQPKNLLEEYEASGDMEAGRIIVFIMGKSPFRGTSYTEDKHGIYEHISKAKVTDRSPVWYEELCRTHPELLENSGKEYVPSEYETDEDRGPAYDPTEVHLREKFKSIPPEARYAAPDVMEEIARKREEARLESQERIRRQFENPVSEESPKPRAEPVTASVTEKPSPTEDALPDTAKPEAAAENARDTAKKDRPAETAGKDAIPPDPFQGDQDALDQLFG